MSVTAETLKALWAHFDLLRGHERLDIWKGLQRIARGDVQGELTSEVIESLFESTISEQMGEYTTPPLVTDFMVSLASMLKPTSILDPMCGSGVMLQKIQSACMPQSIVGVEVRSSTYDVARSLLNEDVQLYCGNIFNDQFNTLGSFDLIAVDAPMGVRVDKSRLPIDLQELKLRELAQYLVVWACRRLNEQGTLAVVMTPSILQHKPFLDAIHSEGYRIRSSINVPAGTRLNTGIPSQIVIIQHGEQKEVFVGQLSNDEKHLERLLQNIRRHKSDKHPSLGRVCKLNKYFGYEALEADYRLREQVRGTRLISHKFMDMVVGSSRHHIDEGTDESVGASSANIFLPQSGAHFYADPSEMPENTKQFTCFELDKEKVRAQYLLQWLETSQGRMALRAAGAYSLVGPLRISSKSLERLTCYIPYPQEQTDILSALRKLELLRTEMQEIETSCWTGEFSGEELQLRSQTVNKEDRYEDWLESLPFPLASILWRHKISVDDPRIRYGVLLHFFEGLAAFLATIHLSAFSSHGMTWRALQKTLLAKLQQQHLSLERATFGTWRVTTEFLAARARKMLKNDEQASLVYSMYATTNIQWLQKLFDSNLATIISKANRIRNDYGHGGAIGESQACIVEKELFALVEQVRSVFGRGWQRYELMQADKMDYSDGSFIFHAPRLMGTRNQFERVKYTTTIPMDTGKLHILADGEDQGLKLLPFVRVIASPTKAADACYFYNRAEKGGLCFVSYHFEQESKVCEPFESTAQTLRELTTLPELHNTESD